MAKTYILGPTELTFNNGSTGIHVNTSEQSPLLTSDLTGSLFSISDKQFMFSKKEPDDETMWIYYTPDGNDPENDYDASIDEFIEIEASAEYTDINVSQAIGLSAGKYSVSVFKEDGDDDPESEPTPEPTPSGGSISKNFAFVDHPRNDLNGIAEIVAPFESESEDVATPETIAKLSKNVTYELHPHNDIDRIRFKGNLTNTENEEEN